MGAFFTNIQARGAATAAVRNALAKITESRGYISPAQNGWITVYLEETETQDQVSLCRAVEKFSKALKTDVIAFMVHDSDIAQNWLYRFGELADKFNSSPDYFGEDADDETRERVKGRAEALVPICVPGTTAQQVDEVLHPEDGPPTFAEETIASLAGLLGLDDGRACLGFEYFESDGAGALPDAKDFERFGDTGDE